MMTSTQIRQSFLDFFKSKSHTIVPSSPLMPDSPNLLFTNAGMNQFVPIFLGQTKCPYTPACATDTQKCIRAGGKHNDLDDVGLDTYHHTFFEMLGNWSFGNYFKEEAIDWAWELVVGIWKFPPQRLYATVYSPDKSKNDPSEFDQDAWNFWAEKFRSVGLDPAVHIVNGNKKDNFWMMGETGPCGPCSELHVDLTPAGDTQGSLVNKGDARCIEIWNLVFIQFNANPDGTFSPLPAKHVDTGMGFERVTSIIQGTKGLKDFANAKISNYETDIFRPIFDALEKMSGKTYASTLPGSSERSLETVQKPLESSQKPLEPPQNSLERSQKPSETLQTPSESIQRPLETVQKPLEGLQNPLENVQNRSGETQNASQIAQDIAFRVIADHIRTLSFAIADGIQPGNTDRNYVLRRILRRAVRYGRTLGFKEPFFYKLVDVLADTMGDVFPEIRAKKKHVQDVIRIEEESFNKTLDRGLELFELVLDTRKRFKSLVVEFSAIINRVDTKIRLFPDNYKAAGNKLKDIEPDVEKLSAIIKPFDAASNVKAIFAVSNCSFILNQLFLIGPEISPSSEKAYAAILHGLPKLIQEAQTGAREAEAWLDNQFGGQEAFTLYDTYGFPLDLTELMARERGLTVDKEGFEKLMDEQRARARAAQKKEVVSVSKIGHLAATKFVGYETLETRAKVVESISLKNMTAVILDTSACYAEMGGQVGDTGELTGGGQLWRVVKTEKMGHTWLHYIEGGDVPSAGSEVTLSVEKPRRDAIQRHHTVTHLLHWALHEVASKEASQKGSFVGPDKLTFDFNSAPLTPQQVADIEKLVNERILENAGVSWTEVPHAEVKSRKDVMQFFGDKYGDTVRVVQIGGGAGKLDGYSMELCGGTHTRATGEIGLFRIVGESAIAAGVRRIEAVAGLSAYDLANEQLHLIKSIAGKINSPVHELDKKIEVLLAHQKELEKEVKIAMQRNASNAASELLGRAHTVNGVPFIAHNLGEAEPDFLQAIADALKGRFQGVIVLGGHKVGAVTLICAVTPEFNAKVQAGKIIQQIAPIVGGKGGGKPDNARGGGKDFTKLDEALAKARSLI
jgi:alanyl-tRNA synthetase